MAMKPKCSDFLVRIGMVLMFNKVSLCIIVRSKYTDGKIAEHVFKRRDGSTIKGSNSFIVHGESLGVLVNRFLNDIRSLKIRYIDISFDHS
jgi:hypothetical protein